MSDEKGKWRLKFNPLFHFRSIRTTMLVSFSALIVSGLLVFLLLSLNYTTDTVLNNSSSYTLQLIDQVNADIDSYISYMDNLSDMMVGSVDVRNYLFRYNSGENKEAITQRLLNTFKTLKDSREDIYNIGIISNNGEYLINDGTDSLNAYMDYHEMDWYQKALLSGKEAVISSSHVQNVVQNDYKWVVTLSRGLVNPVNNQIEGVFFVDLNYSSINDLCEKISLGSKGYIFVVEENGGIVYHPQQHLLYSGLKTERVDEVRNSKTNSFITDEGDNSKLYTISKSDRTHWTVVGVAYLEDLLGNRKETQLTYVLIAAALFVAAVLIAILLSSMITKPIKALVKSMKKVEQGQFENVTLQTVGHNEISALTNSFNIMTEEIHHLMIQNMEEQEQKRKSELMALQSQINPHFLYNTLDSIIWMAEGGKNREVVLMTSSLAKLLRQSISNEDEIVTIASEVEYTRSYLTIQKMRYQDRLEFSIDVDPDILDLKIVKLVLQPLVENAIYHGIKYKETKGMIWVTGRNLGSIIVIRVEDNGIGMTEEQLAHIFEKKTSRKSNGVGAGNVNKRLRLYYGPEYGLTYESQLNVGTTVTIRIPNSAWEEENEEEL
ncbi:sensor histidine kinase [Diplocloster agilis]|uniref:histidine kinase n=2 Tax=Diplocloster agilis TaxID=2850323 RepID=A0A949NG36_9FIRM|nr:MULTISPECIES: sensor histidine kinase [Lachnospiraceae]MBU9738379.1 sensor histidine kinase [Diplocloster agilis]MBU9747160.1 sensor histidine kinase [Diplocloster agilis]MCU6736507.1 sensor histidine kinase [Suonthocola fibrivorans]SCJ91205.1 Probable sensor-like histidine kinase YehU [uncultured Clostridium sp.]